MRRLTDKEINVTLGYSRRPPGAGRARIGATYAGAALTLFIAAQATQAEVNTIPGIRR